MESVAIRKASVDDSEPIAGLVSELGYPTSTSQMRRRLETILDDNHCQTFVACQDGHVLGFVGARSGPLYEDEILETGVLKSGGPALRVGDSVLEQLG